MLKFIDVSEEHPASFFKEGRVRRGTRKNCLVLDCYFSGSLICLADGGATWTSAGLHGVTAQQTALLIVTDLTT
jgi:hypothetical protein